MRTFVKTWLWVVYMLIDRQTDMSKQLGVLLHFRQQARKMKLKDQNDIFIDNRNLKTMCDLHECVMSGGRQNKEILYMAPCGRIRDLGVTAHNSTRCTARTILITLNSIFEWPFREGSDPLQSRSWAVSISAFPFRTRRCSQEETKERKMTTWSVKGLWFVHRLFVDNFSHRNYTDNTQFNRIPLMIVFDKSWVQISVCRSTISPDLGILRLFQQTPRLRLILGLDGFLPIFFFRMYYSSVIV